MSRTSATAAEPLLSRRILTVLTALAFLSPGAWLVVTLPPQPVAQFLHLATAALWLAVFAWRGFGAPVPRPLLLAVGALTGVSLISLATNAFPVQQLLYDLYGEMPALLWLAYPAVFLAAASVRLDAGMRDVLVPTVVIGAALVVVMVIWRWTAGFVTTFGSPAYSIPALAPVPFLALGVAKVSPDKLRPYFVAAAILVAAGLAYAGGGLSALFMLGMGGLTLLAVAPTLVGVPSRAERVVRVIGSALLVVAVIAILVVQVPALGVSLADLGDVSSAEQTVATRLYLWDAGQSMVAERPWFGYGPAGYRFSAVRFYDPGVFAFIAGAGADPIAYSAPSPHSLLWEVLTRLGVVGLVSLAGLLGVWIVRARSFGDEPLEVRSLRLSLAVGFAAYLASLLVTPVHFASGLLGVTVGGFAVAASAGGKVPKERVSESRPSAPRVLAVAAAALLVVYGGWRMVGLSVGAIEGMGDFQRDAERVASAARIVPGEPLNERRLLEVTMWSAATAGELEAARATVDAAPGYISDYTPNLVQFAYVGLTQSEALGVTDLAWERSLLERAAIAAPDLPSLVSEQLHLALLERDLEALPALAERARALGTTYPLSESYLDRAEELLGR